jgi:hypothetical protein
MKKENLKQALIFLLKKHSQGTSDKKEAHAFATTKGLQLSGVVQSINKSLVLM